MNTILLVGCGKMGGALLHGWQQAKLPLDIHIIEPHAATPHYTIYADLAALPASIHPNIIVFAVKPQSLPALLPAYAARFSATPLYVSIAAGLEITAYEKALGQTARIIRAMPNTPATIGKGMTALVGNANVTKADQTLTDQLFKAAGEIAWLKTEAQMHAATALSGSGPAYAFLFLEALVDSAMALGLDAPLARQLATITVEGASAYAAESSETLAQLRKNVTSPGGTTEAALNMLMENDAFKTLVEKALQAAAARSKALSQ